MCQKCGLAEKCVIYVKENSLNTDLLHQEKLDLSAQIVTKQEWSTILVMRINRRLTKASLSLPKKVWE